ncbi:MAG TPA: zf-HC2 domain-containing protein, partial [Gemmatimonadaceae bacterium]|nr:zf-HC2 domain-containing protein [Gemmatimonadaceae bacterium]
MTGPTNDGEGHMKDLEIAAYLDRGLRPDQMDRIEEHLSRCADCRENVVKTQEIVAHERRSRRLFHRGLFLAAAAAVLLVALPSLRSSMNNAPAVITRSSEQATAAIVAYGPVGETTSPV